MDYWKENNYYLCNSHVICEQVVNFVLYFCLILNFIQVLVVLCILCELYISLIILPNNIFDTVHLKLLVSIVGFCVCKQLLCILVSSYF